MMKRRLLLLLSPMTLMSLAAASSPLPSLTEIFATLPAPYLEIVSGKSGRPLTSDERRALVTLYDKKNAYLEAKGTGDTDVFGGAQLTIFNRKSGSPLIGLHIDSNGDDTEHIRLLTKQGDTWQDVTREVLPTITPTLFDQRVLERDPSFTAKNGKLSDCASGTYAYKLPRHGTTIEVYVHSDCYPAGRLVLWHLEFDGATFKLSDPPRKNP